MKYSYTLKMFFLYIFKDLSSFQPGLGPQHLVHHHPQYVCSIMFGRPPPSPAPNNRLLPPGLSTPPPERHSFCLLCGQRFLKKHVKLLALHLQQQHPKKFSQVMDTYFVGEHKQEGNNKVKSVMSSFNMV